MDQTGRSIKQMIKKHKIRYDSQTEHWMYIDNAKDITNARSYKTVWDNYRDEVGWTSISSEQDMEEYTTTAPMISVAKIHGWIHIWQVILKILKEYSFLNGETQQQS